MIDKESLVYKSGDIFLPKPVQSFLKQYWIGSDSSVFYITNWTLVHFGSGVLTALLFRSTLTVSALLVLGLLIHTLWELWQISIGMTPIGTLRGKVDTIVDTVVYMLGLFLFANPK